MITLRRLAAAQYKGIQTLDLTFPERGSFLIEGKNEAGKSTLFDAVHFALYGVPLVGDLAAAIHYGAEEMGVQLGLSVSDTHLDVRRSVRQTAKTLRAEAELEVRRGDDFELVRGARAVTQRLQQELGGLTSEALLNSCLVAQKQLGRLETLGRASREEALTVLLNLGKLSDVQAKLRLRPEDEVQLGLARARVELATVSRELDTLAVRRSFLERQRRLVELRGGVKELGALQARLEGARAAAAQAEAQLHALHRQLEHADRLRASVTLWEHVQELAQRTHHAGVDLAQAERQATEAQAAAAALPPRRHMLERYQEARRQAQALVDRQAQLRELSREVEQIHNRLLERKQVAQRQERLEVELGARRHQRELLQARLAQLVPVAAELRALRQRLAALAALGTALNQLQQQRSDLDKLEAQLAQRMEADARCAAAQAALTASRADFTIHEAARAAARQRDALQQTRALLAKWATLQSAITASTAARRLLADLSLAVAGVEHVRVTGAESATESETAGLRLSLVIDHPLTGALVLKLRLWSGGTELLESRPATTAEAQALRGGSLPSLGATGATEDAGPEAELDAITEALRVLGEPLPREAARARARLAEIDRQLRTPLPEFDEAEHSQARTRMQVDEQALATAATSCKEMLGAAGLERAVLRDRLSIEAAEQACLSAAAQCGLDVAHPTVLAEALSLVVPAAQERSNELSLAAGGLDTLREQIADVDRIGQERAQEQRECEKNLAADVEADLLDRRQRLEDEQHSGAAQVEHLVTGVKAILEPELEPELEPQTRAATLGANGIVPVPCASTNTTSTNTTSTSRGAGWIEAQVDSRGGTVSQAVRGHDAAALRQLAQERTDALAMQVATLQTQAGGLTEAAARVEMIGAELGRLHAALATACRAVDSEAAEAPERLATLTGQLQALDQPALRVAEQEARNTAARADASVKHDLANAQSLATHLANVAAALGHPLPDLGASTVLEPGEMAGLLVQVCPEAASELETGAQPAHEQIEDQLRTLDEQVGHLRQRQREAGDTLGGVMPPDLSEAEQALADLERHLAARRRALDMVGQTRQRMINKVLPDTMANMCLLLPLLTAERYRYAELTPDYRLQVWDERKRGYVEKNLYSGGTQDQFSLALRLGFALAALPRELGTSPGFLFLDEPLSSFDQDRTVALIELLTKGQIATFFQQVFLISHSQTFDPGLFSHHIVMEEGKVQSSA